MILVIEDGSVVDGANSFITAASAGSYLNGRSSTWTAATTDSQETALFVAGQYLNSLNWKGMRQDEDQFMCWPRIGVYDRDGREVEYSSVPRNIKYAQAELAVFYLDGYDLFATVKPGDRLKRKKIDVIEKEFFASAYSKKGTYFGIVNALLTDYLSPRGYISRA